MVDSGIRTHHFRFPNRGDTRPRIIQDTNDSADLNSSRHGHMGIFRRRKETPTTELNILLSKKFFRRRNEIDYLLLQEMVRKRVRQFCESCLQR